LCLGENGHLVGGELSKSSNQMRKFFQNFRIKRAGFSGFLVKIGFVLGLYWVCIGFVLGLIGFVLGLFWV